MIGKPIDTPIEPLVEALRDNVKQKNDLINELLDDNLVLCECLSMIDLDIFLRPYHNLERVKELLMKYL
jgi:hypothetical protein